MNNHTKLLENMEIENMVKKDNIECCVCMEFHWGVKLPNCDHFICPNCYYKMYYGYISHKFYANNQSPIYPEKPMYPYTKTSQNAEIYDTLTCDDAYKEWFINENEDLYNCIKLKSEFVDNINNNILQWFQNNELITKYENDLIQYKLKYKEYIDEIDICHNSLEEEKKNNIKNTCPLCRL